MVARAWSQSELARRAGLPRDAISTYVRASSFPSPPSLKKLASAFGLQPEELLPNTIESAIDEDYPAFEFKVSPSAPSTAWVRVNQCVTTATAVKIAALLEEDHVALNRSRGRDQAALQSDEG